MIGLLALDCAISFSDFALLASICSVLQQLHKTKSAKGLSLLSLAAIVSSRCLHGMSHPFFGLHYRPNVLPMFLFVLMDMLNAVMGVITVSVFVKNFWKSYDSESDDFMAPLLRRLNVDSVKARWIFFFGLIAGSSIAWNFFRGTRVLTPTTAFFCSTYEVFGFFMLLPQMWMFHRERVVSQALGNFIGFTALHRMLTLSFWVIFPYVHENRVLDNRTIQMTSEFLNLLIISDFLFYYIRSKIRGEKEIKMSDDNLV